MSVRGLKKQFHKASQRLKEKINGVEGTKLDEDFIQMEKKTEITHKLIADLIAKTTEYLQPNPAYRAKLSMINTVSRIRGQVKTVGYPQTEGILGDCVLRYGHELGVDSAFGCALVDMGLALKQMAQLRDCLDERVKQSFIDPLQILHEKDLKEIAYHLKKLEGRRLDFDYKNGYKGRIAESEINQAKEKFEESKDLAERSMFNLLQNEVEQVQKLLGLIEATMEYHSQSSQILESLRVSLENRITDVNNRPKREFPSRSLASTMCYTDKYGFSTSSSYDTEITEPPSEKNVTPASKTSHQTTIMGKTSEHPANTDKCYSSVDQPCCRALYNFKPENDKELSFKKDDIIILTNQVDENWYEGQLSGESGFFPISYVKVLVPLPQ